MNRLNAIILCLISCFLSCYPQSAFYNLARQYADVGKYEDAIRLTKQCLEWDTTNPDKFDLFFDFESLCEYYSCILDPDSCLHYADQALNILNDVNDIEHYKLYQLLSSHLFKAGCFERAIDCRKQMLHITQDTYGINSPRLVNEYYMLSFFYQKAGNNVLAVDYAKMEEEQAYQTRDIIDDFPHRRSYDEHFTSLRTVIQLCDEPIAGIQYLLKILNDHRDAIDSESRMHTLNSIWAISRENNFHEGCVAVYKEKALYGSYKEIMTNLINIRAEDSNIKYDIHAAEYAQPLYELVIKDELTHWFSDEEIESLLELLPRYYGDIGLIRKSFDMAKKNYEWRKENNRDLFCCDVMVLISGSGLPEEAAYAADFGENLLKEHRYDKNENILRTIYENLAYAYLCLGKNERANFYIDKIKESNEYEALRAKAIVYYHSGDMKSLLPISIKLNDFKDVPEDNRGFDLLMLFMSARDARDYSVLKKYANDYVSTYRDNLLRNIPFLSDEEQTKYVRNSPFSYPFINDFFIGMDENNHIEWSSAKEAYNYSLLKKGILLISQTEFRTAITNSSDTIIQSQRRMLQNRDNKNFLHNEIAQRNLVNYASHSSSYEKRLSYTWEDVRDALHDNEAAIEFIMCYNFRNFTNNQPNPIYLALIIKNDSYEPITVALSPALNLTHYSPNDILSKDNTLLYNMLWMPLEPHLQGITKIYFSPVENLNAIPIEYASMGIDRVCDKWEMLRISSTREIIDKTDEDKRNNAVLYGGLKYDLHIDELVAISRHGTYHSPTTSRAIRNDDLRYKVKYLPGSLSEVTDIARLFDFSPDLITDTCGTEESFKSLDGSTYDIIHLATHGFFWSESEISKHDNIGFLHDGYFKSLSKEDNAMLRSGLVFSGASVFLEGGELPNDVEDGILTASELSTLNLGKTNLVVLSACDSGLGEISSEGVFGLQRGFKLAGAKSILMSLWKVDDQATYLLMTEFYRHYLSGKSKRQSLFLAQSVLRESEEFSDPYYWGAFVILD